ncbi:hypothetical protein CAEBREN_02176 [Caenorhabditis brenneri]|uniref:Uncharacterized protein n=1 Tax=Caenorhabditis brenneri TaxID=135651 RepID=G0N034_CAEBE|nr:hypothetical protein CAEBREN_02176 [Caenorhabditis brenneri]
MKKENFIAFFIILGYLEITDALAEKQNCDNSGCCLLVDTETCVYASFMQFLESEKSLEKPDTIKFNEFYERTLFSYKNHSCENKNMMREQKKDEKRHLPKRGRQTEASPIRLGQNRNENSQQNFILFFPENSIDNCWE